MVQLNNFQVEHMRCRLTSNARLIPNSDTPDNTRIQQHLQANSNEHSLLLPLLLPVLIVFRYDESSGVDGGCVDAAQASCHFPSFLTQGLLATQSGQGSLLIVLPRQEVF
jgi:hypothetical protein